MVVAKSGRFQRRPHAARQRSAAARPLRPAPASRSSETGLHGQNSTGEYRVAPYSLAEPHHANILISETELRKLGKLPQAQSVWVSVHTREQWQRVQDADVVVWQVNNDASARQVLEILEQDVSVPLVVAAPETLVSNYRDRWLSTGAHAVLTDNDTEVV